MDKNKLIELYEKYKTLSGVANYLNLSLETVRNLFIKNNIEYSKRSKYSFNDNFFDIENEYSFYWAGFIYGDGCIEKRNNNYKLKIQLKQSDSKHLELFLKDLNSNHKIHYHKQFESRPEFKKDYYESCILKISSTKIANNLKNNFNIYPNKTKTIFIPDNILNSNLFNHFLRGLIDADGSYDLKSHRMTLAVNKNTLDNLEQKFQDLNIKYHIQKRSETLYTICVSKYKEILKLIDYLYNNSNRYLDRKKDIVDNILKLEVRQKIELDFDLLNLKYSENKDVISLSKYFNVSTSTIRRRLKERSFTQKS